MPMKLVPLRSTLAALTLWLCLPYASAQNFERVSLQKLSPTQMQLDLDLLWQGIDQFHSGAYWYTPRDSIKNAFDQVRLQLSDSLTVLGFHRLMAPLVGLTREDHTDISLAGRIRNTVLQEGYLFPFSIVFLDRKMYGVWDGSAGDTDLRGQEILSINGQSPQSLALQIGQLFSSDGFIERVKYSDLSDFNFSYFHYLEFGHVPSFEIVYRKDQSTIDTVTVDARLLSDIRVQIQQRYPNEEYDEPEKDPLDFRILNDSTAYLAVHTFDSADLRQSEQAGSFKQFLDRCFGTIAESGIRVLIVDVSQNGGGSEGNENLLYSYLGDNYQKYIRVRAKAQRVLLDNGVDRPQKVSVFPFYERWLYNKRMPDGSYERKANRGHGLMAFKKEPDHKFDGKLYVMISPVTYSGGSEFSNMVYTRGRGTFIGEETGGGFYGNTSGYSSGLKLPHSGITIYLPALQFEMNVEGLPFGRGVIPHRRVIPDIETYLQGSEAVLDFILASIINGHHH